MILLLLALLLLVSKASARSFSHQNDAAVIKSKLRTPPPSCEEIYPSSGEENEDDEDTKLPFSYADAKSWVRSKRLLRMYEAVADGKTECFSFDVSDMKKKTGGDSPLVKFTCRKITRPGSSCTMTCTAYEPSERAFDLLILKAGCLTSYNEAPHMNWDSPLHPHDAERVWCELAQVGPYNDEGLPMYSGSAIVGLGISLCEALGFDLQHLTDSAAIKCIGDLPADYGGVRDWTETQMHPISMYRRGETYYERFGFVPCVLTFERWCKDVRAFWNFPSPREAVPILDIFLTHIDASPLKEKHANEAACIRGVKLSKLCEPPNRFGDCLDKIIKSCPSTDHSPFVCGLVHVLEWDFGDKVKIEGNYARYRGMYCRQSDAYAVLTGDSPSQAAAEYQPGEGTWMFDIGKTDQRKSIFRDFCTKVDGDVDDVDAHSQDALTLAM